MKLFSKLAIAAGVVAIAFSTAVQAQVQNLRVSVPFSFHVGDTLLPAGDYQVHANLSGQHISLTSLDGSESCFLTYKTLYRPDNNGRTMNRGRLVFYRYGSTSFLHRISVDVANVGFELFTTRAERETAQTRRVPETAIIASN